MSLSELAALLTAAFIGFYIGVLFGRIIQMLWDLEHPEDFLKSLGFNEEGAKVILTFRRRPSA